MSDVERFREASDPTVTDMGSYIEPGCVAKAINDNQISIRLLRIKEAAEMLAVSPITVYRMCESGELPSVTLGRARRVPESKLAEWVVRNSQGGMKKCKPSRSGMRAAHGHLSPDSR